MIDKELFEMLGTNKKHVLWTVVLMVLGLLSNVGITASICFAIHLLISNSGVEFYLYPALVATGSMVMRFCATYFIGNLKNLLGSNIKKELRGKTYNKILRLGMRNTDKTSMAGLTQMSMEGVEQLDLYYSSYIPQFYFSMIAPLILFLICLGIDWRVSLILLACVPLIPISIIVMSKYAKKIFAKYWSKYISMGDTFLDSVQGLKELKIFKTDTARQLKIIESAEEFRKITMKVLIMQLASTTIMDIIAYGGAGVGIALAIVGMVNEWTTPIECLFLILISVEFFLPLRAFGSAFHIAMNGASAGKRIIALLSTKEPLWGENLVSGTEIVLRNITFSYDGQRNVLQNVNITFPSCGMTAIVGESGCGKSTIVNLIVGAYRPSGGDITIGGDKLENLARKSYYSRLSVISYDTYIFNTTVRDNFACANKDVSDAEIWDALGKVNLDSFIRDNGGLGKVIIEDANNISGGQKQRLALAINLVVNKEIFIFDEVTSNIDIESEEIIMQNIKRLSKTVSVIVISHRLANVVYADNIIYMESGMVKARGSHSELIDKSINYSLLYKTQKNLEEGYLDNNIIDVNSTKSTTAEVKA